MKKIFVSVGIVALGAAAAHAGGDAGLATGGDNSKPWSVQATLRGFYDDNYNTSSGSNRLDSFGVTISPSIAFRFPMDQTTLGFRYTYGATWYEDRANLNSSNDAWDQSHEFEGILSHSFNERFSMAASDSFVIAQEPGLLNDAGNPYRTQGNNIRNHGEITFNGAITRQLSFVLGYQNTYYDYKEEGSNNPIPLLRDLENATDPSYSGLLDRMEHEALLNLRWQALSKTVLVAGYNYRQVNYTSDEAIALVSLADIRYAKMRDSRSHIFYGGFDQNFSKELILTVRAGVQMTDYYKAPAAEPNDGNTSPWGNLSLTYLYLPGSSVQAGFRYSRNQTDVVSPDAAGSITSDEESAVLFGVINHRFTPKLSGRLTAQWQNSKFYGGSHDGKTEDFLDLGGALTFRINQHFSTEVGYNFSQLTSDLGDRDYDRSRVYLGVTAAY